MTPARRPVAKMPSITLGLAMVLACYSYVLHIVSFHRCECAYDGIAISGPQRRTRSEPTNERNKTVAMPIVDDGLDWITPKPNLARRVGYEDDWLMGWKYRHYDPNLGPRCVHAGDRTPFEEELMCTMPGYIPARRVSIPTGEEDVPSSSRRRRDVSKVIFVSWLDRRLGKAMYTSLMTLIHHNPEYEFIFFDDEDVDRFFCETAVGEEWGIPILSRIKAGAMRADAWRLLIMQRYGGVYVDSDISALGKLPIQEGDTAVSGVGCWGHLPVPGSNGTQKYGGVLEHWAMAFMPDHPYINAAVSVMKDNLLHPDYLLRSDTPEAVSDDSATKRLTGPAMYQWALHDILNRSKCAIIDASFCDALWAPADHCGDMHTFRSFFPEGERFFKRVNLNDTLTHKVFNYATSWDSEDAIFRDTWNYDVGSLMISNTTDPTFCDAEAIRTRANRREIRLMGAKL